MFAEPLLKTSRRRPNARYPHRSCRVWRPPCGESQRVTNESGSLGEGGGWRVEGRRFLLCSETARFKPRSSETEAASHPLTDNPRNCTFPELSLFQDGENSSSTFSSTSAPPPPTPRPQSAFLLSPSWRRSLSPVDFSHQPSSPAVDSAPASSKFHSVIFIFW